jgi:predicted  nucleic acid-binding Zn-ribbon protein
MPKASDKLKNVANALLEAASEMEDLEQEIDSLAARVGYLQNELDKERERRKRIAKLLTEEIDF